MLVDDDFYLLFVGCINVGIWLEFCNDMGVKICCKFVVYIKFVDKMIFVNCIGVKIDEKLMLGLVYVLKNVEVVVLEDF